MHPIFLIALVVSTVTASVASEPAPISISAEQACPEERRAVNEALRNRPATPGENPRCRERRAHIETCCAGTRPDSQRDGRRNNLCGTRLARVNFPSGPNIRDAHSRLAQESVETSNQLRASGSACRAIVTAFERDCRPQSADRSGARPGKPSGQAPTANSSAPPESPLARAEQSLRACLDRGAAGTDAQALRSIEAAKLASGDGAPGMQLQCHETGGSASYRACVFTGSGQSVENLQAGGEPADGRGLEFTPAGLRDEERGTYCSGSVLGDGRTVLTAGHCFSDPGRSNAQMTVTGSDGQTYERRADCNAGRYDFVRGPDLAMCRLQEPVPAHPTYMATVDNSVQGERCVPTGYVLRCPANYFQRNSSGQVTTIGYPEGYNGQLVRSNGQYAVTRENNQNFVNYNTWTQPGSSGGGVVTTIDGYRVILAPVSDGPNMNPLQGGGIVPYYRDVSRLRIQSVPTHMLAGGTRVVHELAR